MVIGLAWRTEFQNASGNCPDSSRPDLSVMVPEIITGTSMPRCFRDFGDGVERRLGVERVEDGLDQQQVGAAVEQALDLLAVGGAQIVEGDGAEAGIGNVGRDRGGAVGRADGAGDEARLAVLGGYAGGGGARELGAFEIQLVGEAREVVIGLRDRGRGKGVGGDDVGAGAQIFGVDVLDRLRLGQDQQVVVAADVAVEIR